MGQPDPDTKPEDAPEAPEGTEEDGDKIDEALGAMQQAIDDRPVVIGLVLDRSGSMQNVRSNVISAYNEFLQEQQRQPGKALFSLVLFDTSFDQVHDLVPVGDVPELTDKTYEIRGMTALYDAIGHTVSTIDKSVANMAIAPSRVVLVIYTDGQENSSRECTREQINALLEAKQNQDSPWDVVFLGANQDAFAEGAKIGTQYANTATYAASAAGTKSSLGAVSSYVVRSRSMAAGGQSVTNAFTKEERESIKDSTADTE
jgi:uncharacterized protein YegL